MSRDLKSQPLESRRSALVVLLVLTLLSGVVHGVLDGRWQSGENKKAAGQRLHEIPHTMGDWTLAKSEELEESAARLLRCYGSLVRTYTHQTTGISVKVALLFGPRGPIAVHTPEVCYVSAGTKQFRKRQVEAVETASAAHSLWSVEFTRDEEVEPTFEVWYAWSEGEHWTAADAPRFWLTDDLYKIQLSGPVPEAGFDPCESFVKALLPHLEQIID